ncbi:hypothetical protein DYI37_10685 [Fulvimarina endophytica]|uniref:Uncharacterized protein n=1 Tax=Fulvimarina endophytica TaxID=2293836 RepID=A0A371X2P6_9HYPH|nr:hypothetical protein [Fulvimarina endophytica]RFC63486.1 hypothetical protein DYI37_10685 [Fulvimarina endophytica]
MTIGNAASHAIVFALAVLASAIVASIVQTQFNLAELVRLGAPITPGIRLETTLADILHFGPVMAAIVAAAFLPAFLVAFLVSRMSPVPRIPLYALAGVAGLFAAFMLMDLFTPMPTLVAAARGPVGLLALTLTGSIGGALFAILSGRRSSQGA